MRGLGIVVVAVAVCLAFAVGVATFRVYVIPDFDTDLWATIRTAISIFFGGVVYLVASSIWRNGS